jgi:hypothetical protein
MQHLDFIVWILCYPIADATHLWVLSKVNGRVITISTERWVAACLFWLGIGYLLW